MQLTLQKEEYLVIGGDARMLTILCSARTLWITQEIWGRKRMKWRIRGHS